MEDNVSNCTRCDHYKRQDCTWGYDYLDTDYAYDCCDYERAGITYPLTDTRDDI